MKKIEILIIFIGLVIGLASTIFMLRILLFILRDGYYSGDELNIFVLTTEIIISLLGIFCLSYLTHKFLRGDII